MIMDKDIPTADPDALIKQYTPLIRKVAQRYSRTLEFINSVDLEDLLQAGRIAVFKAQQRYDPEKGASFITFSYDGIRGAMLRAMGFDPHTGEPPPILESLDERLTDESEETRLDFVPDIAQTAEERTIEKDARQETIDAVRGAVDRLKSNKQREVIRRVWLDGQERETAASEMGMNYKALSAMDRAARTHLKRDRTLRMYSMPIFRVGKKRFNTTWTSATEAAVIWRDEHLGNISAGYDPNDIQT